MPKDEIDNRVKLAAESLDIVQLLDRKPRALSGTPAVARLSSQSDIKIEDELALQFHFDRMHLFDKETEYVI